MGTTSEFIQAASARFSHLGSAFYFTPETVAVGREHGLDGFRFYLLGRGGVLGDVEAPVIESAFGWWHPALIARFWDSARERCDLTPRACGRLYFACAADFGRRHFANVAGLQAFCAAAEKILGAANPAGFALFSGYVGEPLAVDLPGRAMQLAVVVRELMGSAHLLAVLAVGLEPKVAHALRRPGMWTEFGYRDEPLPATTPEDRALLADADALTQRLITRRTRRCGSPSRTRSRPASPGWRQPSAGERAARSATTSGRLHVAVGRRTTKVSPDRTRRSSEEPHDVATLAASARCSPTVASQHLSKLRFAGLIEGDRDGRRVLYRLRGGRVRALLTEAPFHVVHQVSGQPVHD